MPVTVAYKLVLNQASLLEHVLNEWWCELAEFVVVVVVINWVLHCSCVVIRWFACLQLSWHKTRNAHIECLYIINYFIVQFIITSAKEVMFLPVFVCLFVCLCVSKITQKVMDWSFWNFKGMSGMAQTTSDSILGAIRQKSWILDHFEIFITIALKGA